MSQVFQPCSEKLPRTWTKLKFINYFQGFHTIDILEDISKYDLNNSREKTHRGVPLE